MDGAERAERGVHLVQSARPETRQCHAEFGIVDDRVICDPEFLGCKTCLR